MKHFRKRLLDKLKSINKREVLVQLGKILAIVAGLLLFGFLCFWILYKPEWSDYGDGKMSVWDPVTGFRYNIDDEKEEIVVTGYSSKSVKNGCLEIPDSFWGRPVTKLNLWGISSNVVSVKIPDSVTIIQNMSCGQMQEITGGANVKVIASYAFEECTALTKVELGNKIEEIGSYAFDGCFNLKEIRLGNYLEEVKEGAFYRCTSLEKVELGYNVVTIQRDAFKECSSLKEVTKTGNLQYIGENAFASSGIENIDVGNVITIYDEAFAHSMLQSIVLQEEVELGENVFAGTPMLKEK